MKNQYFGDINDYHKYGLIRKLTGGGKIGTAVCWMLTPDDASSYGKSIDYLNQPDKWRHFDPQLYDQLNDHVVGKGVRDIRAVESAGFLPNCRFYPQILSDNADKRTHYFDAFLKVSRNCDLVFFDPDIGLEIKSKRYGWKHSSKYLYWKEVEIFFAVGHSLLIYQHFRRVPRERFIEDISRELEGHTYAPTVYSFRTRHVVFLLVPQTRHQKFFQNKAQAVIGAWGEKFIFRNHAIT